MEKNEVSDQLLCDVLNWLESYEFSKPIKKIERCFSDGTLVAEIIKQHWPNTIDLHNYPTACKVSSKINNWNVLNTKVLKKLKLQITKNEVIKLSNADPKTVYTFLERLKNSVCKAEHEKRFIMAEGDMVQITEDTVCSPNDYVNEEIVQLISELRRKIVELERENAHLREKIASKETRINFYKMSMASMPVDINRGV